MHLLADAGLCTRSNSGKVTPWSIRRACRSAYAFSVCFASVVWMAFLNSACTCVMTVGAAERWARAFELATSGLMMNCSAPGSARVK